MSMSFEDSEVINRSQWFIGRYPGPGATLTPEQEAKLAQLKSLSSEVGELTFDEEIDILIIAMTEINNK
jgi:hypothetical protein